MFQHPQRVVVETNSDTKDAGSESDSESTLANLEPCDRDVPLKNCFTEDHLPDGFASTGVRFGMPPTPQLPNSPTSSNISCGARSRLVPGSPDWKETWKHMLPFLVPSLHMTADNFLSESKPCGSPSHRLVCQWLQSAIAQCTADGYELRRDAERLRIGELIAFTSGVMSGSDTFPCTSGPVRRRSNYLSSSFALVFPSLLEACTTPRD